ncbi:MAG: M20 family metallopeptidase [Gammaproteobacteria bacterium]|nr:M20 family metallopeptidase [Gammaproteobacteria bacterium]
MRFSRWISQHFLSPGVILILSVTQFALATEADEPPLTSTELDILAWVNQQESGMVSLLETITNINSGSMNKAGIGEISAIFKNELEAIGFATSRLAGSMIDMPHCPGSDLNLDLADHLLATRTGESGKLLLMGHMDTVFPADSPFQEFSITDGVIRGPGVFDMKGGLVIMLYALKALNEIGLLENQHISVLLNSDEEVGSLSSRTYLEEQARLHDYGLVFEGTVNNNQIRQRKGLGQARFVVNGRASHAGAAHQDGRSAIRELAYKIIELENMTDYETGLTVNVGMVSGGEARNMVAPCAEAYVDLRYPLPSQGEAARRQFEAIGRTLFSVPRTSDDINTELWVNLHRPPKIATIESDLLLDRTIAIGGLLGEQIGVTDSGGGTDGSLTQAVGLPTLDSLGLMGSGGHSQREQANLSSFVQATSRAAILIYRLLKE